MRTLVVGCDASGKSTFLEQIADRYGDVKVESTATPESRAFKKEYIGKQVDETFVDRRELMYLKLTHDILRDSASSSLNYAGTDASLVTRLSHDVMRRCIGLEGLSNERIIDQWEKDEYNAGINPPDIVVLTHASSELITARIRQRQQLGDKTEAFWGFNAPFFLNAYQERWHDTIKDLGMAGMACIKIDTSLLTTEESITLYDEARRRLPAKN